MGRKKGRVLTIDLEPGEDVLLALEQVLRQVKEGYTSGYEPRWKLKGEE